MDFGPLMWARSEAAVPAAVGDGYPITQDEWSGEKYGGMMERMRAADEGRRTINILDDKWKSQRMTHRVVERMRHPLVSVGETVDNHNLVFMSRGTRFMVPEASEYGWAVNKADELCRAIRYPRM